ncbi:mitotic check point protein Bfa1p [Monosporozyma unispora]|nr:hypothetical protein C6P44_003336 [Kazachstania unispora]
MNDSSFEDIETPYTQDVINRRSYRKQLINRKSMPNIAPTAMSTISSDATAVPNQSSDAYWNSDDNFTNASRGQHYNDFKSNQDYFDKVVQKSRDKRSPTKRSNEFAHKFNMTSDMRLQKEHFLKHPTSMMELKSNKRNSSNNMKLKYGSLSSREKLKSSISYVTLKQPRRSSSSVRFKPSVVNLGEMGSNDISPIREADDNELEFDTYDTNDLNDTVLIAKPNRDDNFLNKYAEPQEIGDNIEGEDAEFILNNDVLQPQFLSQSSNFNKKSLSPVNEQYDKFNGITRKRSGPLKGSPVSRIQTIKQTIDSNSPNTANEEEDKSVYYDPASKQWVKYVDNITEGFSDMDINEHRRNSSTNRKDRESYNLKNLKIRSNSRKPTVVNNMVLDEKNQRWVSVSGDDPDPFANVPDFAIQSVIKKNSSPFLRSRSTREDLRTKRVEANQGQRNYHSIGKPLSRSKSQVFESDTRYIIDSHALEKFYHEENKWHKSIGTWFLMGTDDFETMDTNGLDSGIQNNISLTSKDNRDFMYEIRKMVMNSTGQ